MDSLQFKLCDIQGRLFELFLASPYQEESLVKAFMNGDIAYHYDGPFNKLQWMGEEYLLAELIDTSKDDLLPKNEFEAKDFLLWMGFLYRYWHFLTGEESKKIYKQAPYKIMKSNYLMFHSLDNEIAIANLKEIYNQKRRIKS